MKQCCKIVPVLCLIAVVMLCRCSKKKWYESTEPPSAEKIVQTNKIRKELGLREIKDDWTFKERKSNKEWVKQRQKLNERLGLREIKDDDDLVLKITESWKDNMGRKCKSVIYDKYGEISTEINFYYSGRSFYSPDNDSPLKECLVLTYHYHEGNYMVLVISNDEKILSLVEEWRNTEQGNEENLRFTEKILKEWGLQRLTKKIRTEKIESFV